MNSALLFSVLILFSLAGCKTTGDKPKDSDLAGVYYHVKSRDTLLSIAQKYHLPIDEIKDVNGIEHDKDLKVGHILFLPDPDPILKKIEKLKPKSPKPSPPIAKKERIFLFPVNHGTIIKGFSKAKKDPYDGIAIKAPLGSKVLAALPGEVLFVGDDGTRFGLLVIIMHKDPFITVYSQLDTAIVNQGQKVARGQQIGTLGKSGGASIPHLHFQIRVNKKAQDPKLYLKD